MSQIKASRAAVHTTTSPGSWRFDTNLGLTKFPESESAKNQMKNPNSLPHLLNCRIMTFALPTPRNPVGEENLCRSKISRRLMNPNESLLCTFSLSRFPKVTPDYEWIVFLFLCNVVINYVQPYQGLRRLYLIMNYLYPRVSMSLQQDIIMCWTWTSKDNKLQRDLTQGWC